MRPLQLTIEGLRSFRSRVTVCFRNRDHMAIVGDTGAGKSSVLEAITYSLYGKTSFTAQANQELMNDTSEQLRVVLLFQIGSETWQVARTLRRAGDGSVGQPRAQLDRLDAHGDPIESVEQVRVVNKRVENLVGLDSEAFLRTVILPQGRFSRLLVEDKPSERSSILRQVWSTDEVEAARDIVERACREAAELKARLEQAASAHPQDIDAHLARLETEWKAAAEKADAATAVKMQAVEAREKLDLSERNHERARRVAQELPESEFTAAGQLESIRVIDEDITRQEADLNTQRDSVQKKLARIPVDNDGASSADVATALAMLQDIFDHLAEDAELSAERLRAADEEAERKRGEAELREESAARAADETARHAGKRASLGKAVEAARERRHRAAQFYKRCRESEKDSIAALCNFLSLGRERIALAQRLDAAEQEKVSVERTLQEASERLESARRSDSAAAAAHGLHSGDDCPICRRGLPADWSAPEGVGLQEAQRAEKEARGAVDRARDKVTRLAASRKSVEQRIGESRLSVETAAVEFSAAKTALGEEIELDLGNPLSESLLMPLDAALQEAVGALESHDVEHAQLNKKAAAFDRNAGVARNDAANAGKQAEAARQTAKETMERLANRVSDIPVPFRPRIVLPSVPEQLQQVEISDAGEKASAARHRGRVLKNRAAEREGLQKELSDIHEQLGARGNRRKSEVDEPLGDIVRDVNEQRDALAQAVAALQCNAVLPSAAADRDVDILLARLRALRAVADALRQAAKEMQRQASSAKNDALETLSAIGRIAADGVDAVVQAAHEKAEKARFEEREAEKSLTWFRAAIENIRALQALLQEVSDKELALSDLEKALKEGAFLKWLTMRRSRSLLVHASRMLEQMSSRRYAFVEPRDVEEQWLVLDRDSGQPRSPASLSGGEQFIASLALALGMVEMMARSGGRLESLFLDEGFGSLDRNNLDAAVEALSSAAGGRMVGVISHVRAVAEQFEHVLAVTRDAAGSQVEWLSSQQRQQLSESDAGWEAGLLE